MASDAIMVSAGAAPPFLAPREVMSELAIMVSAGAAPPFLAPREVMSELAVEHAGTSISPTATEQELSATAKELSPHISEDAHELLSMLERAMPPGGHGRVSPSFTSAEGYFMGLTENNSATYLSSGNACLNFFFQVVPSTSEADLKLLLERAWREDPLTALKLVFHLRGVRGTGKSDKERFYYVVPWLHEHHPATLRENMEMVVEFGYFKDAPELLLRLVEGQEEQNRKVEAKSHHKEVLEKGKENAKKWKKKQEAKAAKKKGRGDSEVDQDKSRGSDTDDSDSDILGKRARTGFGYCGRRRLGNLRRGVLALALAQKAKDTTENVGDGYYSRKRESARARAAKAIATGSQKPREERVAASLDADKIAKQKAAVTRKERKLELARRVAKIFSHDVKFQLLYLEVAKVFASRLKEDLKALQDDRLHDVSLAAKWAPSVGSSYDLRTLLCYAIATQIYPMESHPEYEGMDVHVYGYNVRERLRKEVLVPLRKVLELPEFYTSFNKWGEVNYRRVASVAMTRYKSHFLKHDEERFTQYLIDVKAGKEKVAAGALLPHMILKAALVDVGQEAEVAELQWKRLLEDLKKKGSLGNCLAICDVSGSMIGEPMEVCIALGMLLSDLCEKPWKGHVITFSQNPQIHRIAGDSLKERHHFTKRMDWGVNTNFQRVFDTILKMARQNKLAPEKMIKRLFVFSDMEFDDARGSRWSMGYKPEDNWETDYKVISRKFRAAGYGTPPDIVFWNLRSSKSVPVVKNQPGVALVSGFSQNILKMFLEHDGAIDPLTVMKLAIGGEEYRKLKLVD